MPRAPIDSRQFGHELRTPLHAILGNVELLLDGTAGPLSTEARKCVGEIQTASRQLSRQVKTLLLWSELRASDAGSDGATLDLIALLRDLRAAARAAALTIEPPDARLVVHGDRFWLQTLVGEILELGGAGNAPAIRLESRADGRSLDFSWRHCAGEAVPLQVALIEAIAQIQGAAVALTSNGLSLYWPAARLPELDRASNAPGGAIEADRKGPGRDHSCGRD
ncbi:MAG: histidine kinase dimerization/phospho-acceptor domain-containing protein [Geminicoccaceae bacterium]